MTVLVNITDPNGNIKARVNVPDNYADDPEQKSQYIRREYAKFVGKPEGVASEIWRRAAAEPFTQVKAAFNEAVKARKADLASPTNTTLWNSVKTQGELVLRVLGYVPNAIGEAAEVPLERAGMTSTAYGVGAILPWVAPGMSKTVRKVGGAALEAGGAVVKKIAPKLTEKLASKGAKPISEAASALEKEISGKSAADVDAAVATITPHAPEVVDAAAAKNPAVKAANGRLRDRILAYRKESAAATKNLTPTQPPPVNPMPPDKVNWLRQFATKKNPTALDNAHAVALLEHHQTDFVSSVDGLVTHAQPTEFERRYADSAGKYASATKALEDKYPEQVIKNRAAALGYVREKIARETPPQKLLDAPHPASQPDFLVSPRGVAHTLDQHPHYQAVQAEYETALKEVEARNPEAAIIHRAKTLGYEHEPVVMPEDTHEVKVKLAHAAEQEMNAKSFAIREKTAVSFGRAEQAEAVRKKLEEELAWRQAGGGIGGVTYHGEYDLSSSIMSK